MYTQSLLEEQLKKGENLAVGWPWRLLVLMTIIFILAVVVYFGMMFGFKPYLNSQIKNLEQKISNLSQSVDEDQQEKIIGLYSQFTNIKNLFEKRKSIGDFFNFIENNTYSNVNYKSLSLNLSEREVKIEGTAPNYETLVKQLTLMEKTDAVEKVFLENSSLSDLGKGLREIKFSLRIIFKNNFF
ncbi:hypothetical protein A2999_00325 [Candidatus Wolfebacteria bacterium RIFCSPLOWO2_01_FULL_38_11]|uniref:Fimbrial assembly family protein n=2 Tax=Candidatus Wolfeibacteriota TaxID=1752735 RepID=A0A0G0GAX3_9BACT|nr:MAG: hypothetical protein US36_C0003G0039 [Candidatus Wolfebacteria bacterium GW2011_GWC1_37_10]OGM90410.1 MAG: hypothetical protein A2999_00325 [Candidatus Wolfebacteria bacterium RIFCSPLOWO2_01_FULL_38_11]